MLSPILSILLLSIFAKVGQTESAVVIRPRALSDHATIASEYSEEIAALQKKIILENQITQIHIEANTTALINLVTFAAAEKYQDIQILQSTIQLLAQKPAASNGYPKTCLKLQTLYAETLSVKPFNNCYPKLGTDDAYLKDALLDIIRLGRPLSTLVSSCQVLNPIASLAAAMRQCIEHNLSQLKAELKLNVARFNTLLLHLSNTTTDCVDQKKKTLDQQITNIHMATTLCFI